MEETQKVLETAEPQYMTEKSHLQTEFNLVSSRG